MGIQFHWLAVLAHVCVAALMYQWDSSMWIYSVSRQWFHLWSSTVSVVCIVTAIFWRSIVGETSFVQILSPWRYLHSDNDIWRNFWNGVLLVHDLSCPPECDIYHSFWGSQDRWRNVNNFGLHWCIEIQLIGAVIPIIIHVLRVLWRYYVFLLLDCYLLSVVVLGSNFNLIWWCIFFPGF